MNDITVLQTVNKGATMDDVVSLYLDDDFRWYKTGTLLPMDGLTDKTGGGTTTTPGTNNGGGGAPETVPVDENGEGENVDDNTDAVENKSSGTLILAALAAFTFLS